MPQKGSGVFAMTTKHRITVNLGRAEYEALQRIAENADRSLAWLGRRAICNFIAQSERANPSVHTGFMPTKIPEEKSLT